MTDKGLYTIAEMVKSIIREYKLDYNGDQDSIFKTYRGKIYRAIHTTGMWEKAIIQKNGKKEIRYFTEKQKQKLVTSKELYDYISKHSSSEPIKNRKSYEDLQKEIGNRRNEHINFLDSLAKNREEIENNPFSPISNEEFLNHKMNIMINAIFELFFTTFDDDLLYKDMNLVRFKDEMDLNPEEILAEERLLHPKGNYFEESNKLLGKLLNKLSSKQSSKQ